MSSVDIVQADADALIAMEKHRATEERFDLAAAGSLAILLQSPDKREQFTLDIRRARIDLLKGKYQSRARQAVVLVRLDFGGAAHRNPDGAEISCPHLHLCREGYGDKWAVPALVEHFDRIDDLSGTLDDFMRFCNVTLPPHIERGLFA